MDLSQHSRVLKYSHTNNQQSKRQPHIWGCRGGASISLLILAEVERDNGIEPFCKFVEVFKVVEAKTPMFNGLRDDFKCSLFYLEIL